MVDFNKAIKRSFSNVGKLLLGIVLSIVPFIRWIAFGYIIKSSAMARSKQALPEWTDAWDLFIKGMKGVLIKFVYMIPGGFVFFILGGVTLIRFLDAFFRDVVPARVIVEVVAGNVQPGIIGYLIQNNWPVLVPYLIAIGPIMLISGLLWLLACYVTPAAVIAYARSDKLPAAFNFGKVFRMAFTSNYFFAAVISACITTGLFIILGWLPILGGAAAFFISGLIRYSLFAEVIAAKKQ